jgi:hypothetical protein
VEHLVPELQRRGVYKKQYASRTLREKLFGAGPRLAPPHPGASFRNLQHARDVSAAAEGQKTPLMLSACGFEQNAFSYFVASRQAAAPSTGAMSSIVREPDPSCEERSNIMQKTTD